MSSIHNQADPTDRAVNELPEAFAGFVLGNLENYIDPAVNDLPDDFEEFDSILTEQEDEDLFEHFIEEPFSETLFLRFVGFDERTQQEIPAELEMAPIPLVAPIIEDPAGIRSITIQDTIQGLIEEFRSRCLKAVDRFLSSFPAVEIASLPEDERSCPICLEKYESASTTTAATTSDETEPAVRLACRHVAGKNCLRTWLVSGNLTCPFCRAHVYAT